MLRRLCTLTNVKLTNRFLDLLAESPSTDGIRLLKVLLCLLHFVSTLLSCDLFPVFQVDIKSVSCGVKQLPLMNLSEGKMLLIQVPFMAAFISYALDDLVLGSTGGNESSTSPPLVSNGQRALRFRSSLSFLSRLGLMHSVAFCRTRCQCERRGHPLLMGTLSYARKPPTRP